MMRSGIEERISAGGATGAVGALTFTAWLSSLETMMSPVRSRSDWRNGSAPCCYLCEGGPALAAGPFLVSRCEPVLTRMETAGAELTLGHVCRHGRQRRSEDERQLFGDGDLPRRHAAGRQHRAIDTIRGRGRHLNVHAAAVLG